MKISNGFIEYPGKTECINAVESKYIRQVPQQKEHESNISMFA
jgi:hypothetical protein